MTRVVLWGTRGSIAAPGPETARYGGNTSCVEVRGDSGTLLVLDAGTGMRRLGASLPRDLRRVDVLLTHLHMDHIQGLGFFAPLQNRQTEVHIWGPASTTMTLRARLTRYLSPPTFPVRLRDLARMPVLHEVPCERCQIGEFCLTTAMVCHPDPTVGFRIEAPDGVLTYLPDHEPALGVKHFPISRDWTSGYAIAAGADLLLHDAQYTRSEYAERVGWGHSAVEHAFEFAKLSAVRQLVPFHHDPGHSDEALDRIFARAIEEYQPTFKVTPAVEGATFKLGERRQPAA